MPGYISEYDHHGGAPGTEFVEVAVPKGTDTSGYTVVIYNSGGFVEATLTLGPVINTMGGMDVYVIDDTTPGWTYIDPVEAVALVDDVGSLNGPPARPCMTVGQARGAIAQHSLIGA